MNLQDYFHSFTEEELVSGAELLFSGDMKDISVQKYKAGGVNRIESLSKVLQDEIVELKGKWEEQGLSKSGRVRKCSIYIAPKNGLIVGTECSCEEFEKDRYGCGHVAALLAQEMLREHGEEVFRGTRLEALLSNLTGAEDPFAPGVMKRTDSRLLSLLRGGSESPLPVWKEAVQAKETWRIECGLDNQGKHLLLELRIGTGKRLVQVKDLPQFLTAYQDEKILAIGRSEYQLIHSGCDAYSREILDFMCGLSAAADKGLYRQALFASLPGKPIRYMVLSGAELDTFLELNEGRDVLLNDALTLPVKLNRKGLGVNLKKKAYGATLRIRPVKTLAVSGNSLYLYDDEGIFRVRTDSTEKTQELLSMLKWADEMYIRESEIAPVCRNLLPIFRQYGTVAARGMEAEDYEREQPSFLFELDYNDDQVLTCKPFAVYRRQDFRSPLYDSLADAGKRNGEAESQVAELLPEMFQTLDESTGTLMARLSEEELFRFMQQHLPRLEQIGIVMATDSVKRRRIRKLNSLKVGVSVDSGHLLLSLKETGLSPEEMAGMLSAYHRKKRFYRLKSGEFVDLEKEQDAALDTASELFESYGQKDPEKLRVPTYRALYLQEMLEEKENVDLDETGEFRELVRNMDPAAEKDSPVPPSLKEILRPYQTEGFRWIRMLKRCGFGGILADDMGLGKTLQTLAFLLSEKLAGKTGEEIRTLVVCPASLVYNWKKEIETYAPELSSVVIAGTQSQRRELLESSKEAEVWITSYDLLKRDIELYEGLHFANEIIDEAQFVKNQKTQAAQSVRLVDSDFRMALTGTPIENYLSELWSICDYLMSGFLYSYTRFQKDYEVPIVAEKDEETLDRLRRMVHPFILRRLKKQVLKDLPDKLEETISVRMEGEQKKLYDAAVEEVRQALSNVSSDEFRSGKIEFLSMLTRLRQICCDPALIYEDYHGGSAKLDGCMQLVGEALDGGHKLLIFSQFTTMLDIIGERLKEEKILFHRIDGSVSKEKRMEMVDSFAYDEVPVFLISLKAGGTGLNLTAADIVIHYDPWWNQAAQDQATDRTHRIGQTETVTVYELIAEDSIEEKIRRIKEGKAKLVEDVLSGEQISSAAIDREDMLALLG